MAARWSMISRELQYLIKQRTRKKVLHNLRIVEPCKRGVEY